MAAADLDTTRSRQDYFQHAINRMVSYWNENEAIKNVQVDILDKERETILKAITLALDTNGAWSASKNLITTFTPYMERRGHWEAWHTLLHKAIEKSKEQQDLKGETTLTALLARLCQRQSRFKESVKLYRNVIRLAKQTGNKFEEARACSNLGYYFSQTPYWYRSEVLCCHALQLFTALESQHGLAHTHNHLGLLYMQKQEWKNAQTQFERAIELWQSSDQHSLISAYNNLGSVFSFLNSPDQALHYFQKAHQQAELTGEEALKGLYLTNIAVIQFNKGKIETALKFAREAESIYKHHKDHRLADTWFLLGEIYLKLEGWEKSSTYFESALHLCRTSNRRVRQAEILAFIITHFLENNDQSKSQMYFDKYSDIYYRFHLEKNLRLKEKYLEFKEKLSS